MNKNRVLLTATLGMFLGLTSACSSSKTAEHSSVESSGDGKGTAPSSAVAKQADKALVRFVNATYDGKDLAFGDLTVFPGVGDTDVTAYKELPAERHEFKLFAKGAEPNALASDSEGLSSGKHYTVLAVPEKNGKYTITNVTDDLTLPSPGQAKIRVINLAPTMKDVDVYAEGKKSPLIGGAGFNSATDYKDVSPSEAAISVRNSMSKKNGVQVKDLDLKAGKLYTILVFQDKKGSVKVKSVEDQFTVTKS